jgi:hypothetical protein
LRQREHAVGPRRCPAAGNRRPGIAPGGRMIRHLLTEPGTRALVDWQLPLTIRVEQPPAQRVFRTTATERQRQGAASG